MMKQESEKKILEAKKKEAAFYKEYEYIESIGFGYLRVATSEKTNLVNVEVNRKELSKEKWEVQEPFTNISTITVSNDSLLILKNFSKKKETTFPIHLFTV